MSEELNENVLPEATPEETPVVAEAVEAIAEEPKAEEVKVDAPAEEPTAITTSDFARSSEDTKQALGSVADGIIGVSKAPATPAKPKKAAAKPKKTDTVAIHSTRNVTWNGVGKVYIGYNIVDKDAADKWLSRNHTRLATPEEVAKEFGK